MDYEPRKLDPRDLSAPMAPGVARLPAAHREELHARRRALVDHTSPTGSTMRRRLVYTLLCSGVCVPLVTWFFTPAGLDTLLVQTPLAGLYGAALAYLQPSDELAGWLLVGIGAVTLAVTGVFTISLGTVIALFAYYVLGRVAGLDVTLRRMDGA